MDQDGTWRGGRPRPRPHCARWRACSPDPQNGAHPQFSAHVYCGQTAGCIRIPLGTEVDLGPGDIVRWGPSSPEKGHSPQFSAHVYCGQTAGWVPLGTKVGLGPWHIMLNGDPPTPIPKRGTAAPSLFGPCLWWPRSPMSTTADLLLHSSRQRVVILYNVR